MPDMVSSNIPLNTPPEVKVNPNGNDNKIPGKIPSNIKIYDKKGQTLGKDDFLKLFVTQLSKQDPMNPVNDKEFIAQMAQFSALEQMNNVASNISELKSMQANTMVGKLITGKDVLSGNMVTGEVTRVIYDGAGNIFLKTKNSTIQMKDVISLENVQPEIVSRETKQKEMLETDPDILEMGKTALPRKIQTREKSDELISGAALFMNHKINNKENDDVQLMKLGQSIFTTRGLAEYDQNK